MTDELLKSRAQLAREISKQGMKDAYITVGFVAFYVVVVMTAWIMGEINLAKRYPKVSTEHIETTTQ